MHHCSHFCLCSLSLAACSVANVPSESQHSSLDRACRRASAPRVALIRNRDRDACTVLACARAEAPLQSPKRRASRGWMQASMASHSQRSLGHYLIRKSRRRRTREFIHGCAGDARRAGHIAIAAGAARRSGPRSYRVLLRVPGSSQLASHAKMKRAEG